MENVQLTQEETNSLLKLFSSLRDTASGNNTGKVNNARDELRSLTSNTLSSMNLMIKGLAIPKINHVEISSDLHTSLIIYLKNMILVNQRNINDIDIFEFFKKLFNLFLTVTNNENLQSERMIILFNNLIKTLCDNNISMIYNEVYLKKLFEFVLNKVINNTQENNFLFITKNGLGIMSCFLAAKGIGQQLFLDLILNYLIPLSNYIFSKVCLYIVPKNNLYENDFIEILNNLYETFYLSLFKLKRFFPSIKRKEIADEFFKKYGKFTYELIQIVPINTVEVKNKFGIENPIIVFDEEYNEINNMKSKAFQFMSLIIEYSTMSSYDNGDKNNNNIDEKNYKIDNNELIDITSKIIKLIIKSYENILNDNKKFYFLRKLDDESSSEYNYHNMLLYHMTNYLAESLVKEPIKSDFYQHIKLFLLNILFPILTTVDSEKYYMICSPDEYLAYFNDLLYNHTLTNFRIAGLVLIKKLSHEFIDIYNFILSYIIGMFNSIMNGDKNQITNEANNVSNNINTNINISNQYNAYMFYKSQNVLIDKCSDEIKLDFCLLLLILLQKDLLKYDTLKNKLKEVMINSKDKYSQIKDILIKIKLCHLFKLLLPKLFNEDKQNENNKKNNNDNDNININIIDKDINNNNNTEFIEKTLSFLFENLIQKENLGQGDYNDSLGNEASDAIIDLCKFTKSDNNDNNNNNFLTNKLNNLLQMYFISLIDLIDIISLYSFFNVLEKIIKDVKINNRKELFNCLDKLTKRFKKEYDTGDINSQTYCPKYFSIISSFLTGVNKINIYDINNNDSKIELDIFNNMFKPPLDLLDDIFRYLYYENLVKSMVDYVNAFKGINEQSYLVLQSMLNIIENERTFSETSYTFVKTFLTYIQNNISNKNIDQEHLFQLIIKIMEKAYEIDPDQYDFSNLYALLLTLQIFSKNMNISEKTTELLLSKSLKCFNFMLSRFEKDGSTLDKKQKDIVIFGIFALGYIYKPEQMNNVLEKLEIIIRKEELKLYEEEEFEKFDMKKYINILEYINEFDIENELLRKCLILQFCSMLKMDKLNQYFNDNNQDLKIKFLKIFANFMIFHKNEVIQKRNKLMNNEINFNFNRNEDGKFDYDNESEEEEEEQDEEEEKEQEQEDKNKKFNKRLNYILEVNENIKNSDEYQFFKDAMDYVKNNDAVSINMLYKELTPEKIKELEEVYHAKKFKVNYQGQNLEISRRIVNIKRNNN